MKVETLDARRFKVFQQCWAYEALARFLLLKSDNMLQNRTCWGERNQLSLDITHFDSFMVQKCYLPLSTMSDVTDIPYYQLTYVSYWHTREEVIHRGIIALVDHHHSFPFVAAFTDEMDLKFFVWPLHTKYRSGYFGPERGAAVHDMKQGQYSHPCLHAIQPSYLSLIWLWISIVPSDITPMLPRMTRYP